MELPNLYFKTTILELAEMSATIALPLVYVNAPVLSDEGFNINEISIVDFVIFGKVIVGIYFTLMVAVTDFER